MTPDDWLNTLIWIAGISFVVMAAFIIGSRPSGQRHAAIIISAIPLGLLLGSVCVKLQGPARLAEAVRGRIGIHYLAAAISAIGLGLLIYWCGMRQFAANDCSLSIDLGWRLINGQRPYIDFPCTPPPGYYLGCELGFRLFGVFWRAQVLITVLYAVVTFVWLWKLLDIVLDHWVLAIVIALCCESASMLLISFWWYNPITSITAAVFVGSCIAVLRLPDSALLWISVTISLALLALMKPNVAGIAILGCIGPLFFVRKLWARTLIASISAFAVWLFIIKIHGITIQQVLGSYFSVADRGFSPSNFHFMEGRTQLEAALSILALLCTCLPWIAAVRKPALVASPRGLICLAALVAGTYGFLTNSDSKFVDLPLQLLSGILLIAQPGGESTKLAMPLPWKQYVGVLLAALTVQSAAQAVTRHRVEVTGYGLFFEYPLRDQPLSNDFFRGLHAGNNLEAAIERISDLCRLPDRRPIFFGPRLQWAYAAFHIDSPRNQPVFWQPGVMFPISDEDMYMRNWANADYGSLVFLDLLFYSKSYLRLIETSYRPDPDLAPVSIARDAYHEENPWSLVFLKRRPIPAEGAQ